MSCVLAYSNPGISLSSPSSVFILTNTNMQMWFKVHSLTLWIIDRQKIYWKKRRHIFPIHFKPNNYAKCIFILKTVVLHFSQEVSYHICNIWNILLRLIFTFFCLSLKLINFFFSFQISRSRCWVLWWTQVAQERHITAAQIQNAVQGAYYTI